MGMFDDIECRWNKLPKEHRGLHYQSKDIDCCMESFLVDRDGYLWKLACEYEDRSDPNATGIMRLAGCMTQVNERWVKTCNFNKEVRIYTRDGDYDLNEPNDGEWIEYELLFKDSRVIMAKRIYESWNGKTFSNKEGEVYT
jgi:hypothetical protein